MVLQEEVRMKNMCEEIKEERGKGNMVQKEMASTVLNKFQ